YHSNNQLFTVEHNQDDFDRARHQSYNFHEVYMEPNKVKQQHEIRLYCTLLIALGLIILLSRLMQNLFFSISGAELTKRIRAKAIQCMLKQEVGWFDRQENHSGVLCERLSTDALAIQNVYFEIVLSKKTKEILEQASVLATETLQNIRTVVQLTKEDFFVQKYSRLSKTYSYIKAITHAVAMSNFYFTLAATYVTVFVLVKHEQIKTENIMMVVAFILFTIQPFQIIFALITELGKSITSAQSFIDLFERQPSIDNCSTQGKEIPNFSGNIKFDLVQFRYPTRPEVAVLNKFKLNINRGQCIALIGASGCGKSTIIQLIERFYDVSGGYLYIDGHDIKKLNLQWLRSKIGLISQEPTLFDMTVQENIAYGDHSRQISMKEIIEAAKKANIHDFIQLLPQ
ncbi:unnamed protein product, partial [Didymodactylos carnosus]